MNDITPENTPEIPEEPVQETAPLTEQKKNALLRYMAILFGVSFLLVLLSFLIQLRDSRETISNLSQSSASALQNAGKLQEDNEKLVQANKELESQLTTLQRDLETAKSEKALMEENYKKLSKEKKAIQEELEEQNSQNEQLTAAVCAWLMDDKEDCRVKLSQLDRAALNEQSQTIYDQLIEKLDEPDNTSEEWSE